MLLSGACFHRCSRHLSIIQLYIAVMYISYALHPQVHTRTLLSLKSMSLQMRFMNCQCCQLVIRCYWGCCCCCSVCAVRVMTDTREITDLRYVLMLYFAYAVLCPPRMLSMLMVPSLRLREMLRWMLSSRGSSTCSSPFTWTQKTGAGRLG